MFSNRMRLRCLAILCLWLVGIGAALAALPTGISGPWYNPAQSGHGLSIEILANNRALVFWYVYDSQGNPVHVYIEGAIVGHRIEGNAFTARGIRFGIFDPAERILSPWGSVNIEFSDCTHAKLEWNALSSEYGRGIIPIQQLTPLAGLTCSLIAPGNLPHGLYEGVLELPDTGKRLSAWGFVDRQGTLWGIERWSLGDRIESPGTHQGRYDNFSRGQSVFRADLETVTPGDNPWATMRTAFNSAFGGRLVSSIPGRWSTTASPATAEFSTPVVPQGGIAAHRWRQGPAPGIELVAPITMARLQNDYVMEFYEGELIRRTIGHIQIDAQGGVCIQVYTAPCEFAGSLQLPDGDIGLIHFELHAHDPSVAAIKARGWLSRINGEQVLVVVGDNDQLSVGFVGRAAL